ncbi:MAG: cation:proton antiporter [Psychroflexus sp.]|jgi:CPA2 family monovalent cation:H+ antiporter-2|nr:cation:proton antiporter [Psychroflexus sp.]
MHLPILTDLLILFSFSIVIVFLLQRLKLPSIIGFLITGVIIGPHGLAILDAKEEIDVLSEIGVILLLFVIGMELSLKQLASMRKTVFIGGALQVGLTILIAGMVYYLLGNSIAEAIFVGFLFSLSSTAIVLNIYQKRNEMNTPQGKNALAILIFQDVIVVPMMLFTPLIAGEDEAIVIEVLSLVVKSVIVVVLTVISARYLVPPLLHQVAKTKNKELFLLTTITLCFAVAFLTNLAGLSLALGAFIAGLIISESPYSYQATSSILPFRELFTSIFFISVGMLLDVSFFINHVAVILLLVIIVFIVKSIVVATAMKLIHNTNQNAILTGLALFQVGEFAFIISKVGIEYELLNPVTNQYFLSVSVVSMLITPFVIIFSEKIAVKLIGDQQLKVKDKLASNVENEISITDEDISNHLIIIGYGVNGRNLAKAAYLSKIPYLVVDYDADIVKEETKKGIPIIFGDASEEEILQKLHLKSARSVVIAIADLSVSKDILKNIRSINSSVYVLVRTRYVKATADLLALGADEVIPEEFETSINLFSKVMHNFLVPEDDIHDYVEQIRSDHYELFDSTRNLPLTYRDKTYPDFNITCLQVNRDTGKLIGKSLAEIGLRVNYGVQVLSIQRGKETIDQVTAEDKILKGDKLYVQGKPENIETFHRLIQ